MGSKPATMTCLCKCSNGTIPSPLIVTQVQTVMGVMPGATIFDTPKIPYGMCNNPMNPAVAAATAAAAGVLTPAPCIPVFLPPWVPGSPTVLLSNKPVLTKSSKLLCAYGGVTTIKTTTANTTTVK